MTISRSRGGSELLRRMYVPQERNAVSAVGLRANVLKMLSGDVPK